MKTVFIGAGHSSTDPGAVSADRSLREADLAVDLRDRVAAILLAKHIPIKTDGSNGSNAPLRDSIRIARTCDGPRIEVHFNAGPPTAKGVECLALLKHRELAQLLCQAISRHTGSPLRGVLGYKPQDSGQHHRLAFCVDADGLILEVEFISNPKAMAEYLVMRERVAESLANVLAEAAL